MPLAAAHITDAPESVTYRASVPPALAGIVVRCLEKNRADEDKSPRPTALPMNVFPVTDLQDDNDELLPRDAVENTIRTNSDSKDVIVTCQLS